MNLISSGTWTLTNADSVFVMDNDSVSYSFVMVSGLPTEQVWRTSFMQIPADSSYWADIDLELTPLNNHNGESTYRNSKLGRQHLGNILGAIRPAIEMSNDPNNEAYLFIADQLNHSERRRVRRENLLATAAAWLACTRSRESGLHAQSDLPECTELTCTELFYAIPYVGECT